MGILILINLLPDDIEWRVIDQNIEQVDYDDDADLIAVSFFTPRQLMHTRSVITFVKGAKR